MPRFCGSQRVKDELTDCLLFFHPADRNFSVLTAADKPHIIWR